MTKAKFCWVLILQVNAEPPVSCKMFPPKPILTLFPHQLHIAGNLLQVKSELLSLSPTDTKRKRL